MNLSLQHSNLTIPVHISKDGEEYFAEALLPTGISDHEGPTTVFATGSSVDDTLEELRKGIQLCIEEWRGDDQ